ncbi:dynamin family protein [Colletotrichum acutatum]
MYSVDIEPAEHRNAAEKERLKEFSRKESADGRDSRDLLNQCITDAHNAICDGSTETSPIKDDVLSIRITGPNRRALQLVDLPGLIKFDSTRSGIVKKIEDMVRSYMAMKQSTILAVVPGNNDSTTPLFSPFARNTILKAIEPSGNITTLNRLEWHLIRNLGPDSAEDRDSVEARLFEQAPWTSIPQRQLGIQKLRSRLREIYFSAAEDKIPQLRGKLETELGKPKFTCIKEEPQPKSLAQAFQKATQRLREAAREQAKGTYAYDTNQFDDTSSVLLRSRVREQDHRFRDEMNSNGHLWRSHAGLPPKDPHEDLMPPTPP